MKKKSNWLAKIVHFQNLGMEKEVYDQSAEN